MSCQFGFSTEFHSVLFQLERALLEVRACIRVFSNSARPPRMVTSSLPCAEVVSAQLSATERNEALSSPTS